MNSRLAGFPVFLLSCAVLCAQTVSLSQIGGTVRDSTGSVLPAAQVTVTQTDTGLTARHSPGPDGVYLLPSLPVGPYKLEVKKEGFGTYSQSGIVLQVGGSPNIEVTMQIGAVSQEVNVEACGGDGRNQQQRCRPGGRSAARR